MARRSGRLSDITAASPPNGQTGRKRARLSEESTPRPTKRKAAPKKSPHFPKRELSEATGLTSEESSEDEDESEYGSDGDQLPSPSSATDEDSGEDFSDSSAGGKVSKIIKRQPLKKTPSKSSLSGGKSAELWRPGADIEAAPGTEVIIKKPKARAAGDTPYRPDTIHPNTMLFLGDLKRNNDREWLKSMRTSRAEKPR